MAVVCGLWFAPSLTNECIEFICNLIGETNYQQPVGLGASKSENRPQRGQFLPDLQPHSSKAMGQKDGEKWTAAVDSQPTLPKSDRLLVPSGAVAATEIARVVPKHRRDEEPHMRPVRCQPRTLRSSGSGMLDSSTPNRDGDAEPLHHAGDDLVQHRLQRLIGWRRYFDDGRFTTGIASVHGPSLEARHRSDVSKGQGPDSEPPLHRPLRRPPPRLTRIHGGTRLLRSCPGPGCWSRASRRRGFRRGTACPTGRGVRRTIPAPRNPHRRRALPP